ncbi:MAG: ABC transporter ATP-binding protein [Ignavibacteria bacterium]|nr:ABC transporter ATP-binding protein [Ignavibacteria bacterium]
MEDRNLAMNQMSLAVAHVSKQFDRRWVFREISFSLSGGESIAITGKNGSGKSTLVKILCGVLSATTGNVRLSLGGKELTGGQVRHHIGLVSPYLQLYDEFSGAENLDLLSRIRAGGDTHVPRTEEVLKLVGLWERRRDYVRTYSSGMKQRLKYAFALLHRPFALLLDEPTSNLDAEGISIVKGVIEEQKRSGILIVATNNDDEASWCSQRVHLGG